METNFDIRMPFAEHLGLRLLEKADGHALIEFDARPAHENSWKGVHGGVILTFLDVAMSSAARSLDVTCIGCTTVEMKTNFLAAGRGRIVAAGHAQRAGRSLIFAEGEAKDAAGKLLAKGSGTFKLLYPKGTDD